MATNPYFNSNYYSTEEQSLVEDLIIESIQQYGLDLYYLPRELVNYDQLFGEDTISKFENAYKVEFFVNSIENFGGESDVLTKFGLEIHDELSLIVSIKRFAEAVVAEHNSPTMTRPREGDIVFFPQDPAIFEISFVEDMPYYFQLGKIHTYELRMKKIDSAGEKIQTGIPEIDDVATWTSTLSLILGAGTGDFTPGETVYQGASLVAATASAEVVTWDSTTKKLVLIRVKGEFVAATNVVGNTSVADWTYPVADTSTYLPNDNKHNQGVVDNELIQDQTEPLLDETESNPLLS